MASLPRRLLLQSRQCPSRIRCRAPQKHTARSLATTPRRLANEDSKLPPSSTAAPAPPVNNEAPAPPAANVATGSPSRGAAKYHEPSTMTEDEIAAAQLEQLVSDLKNLDPAAIADGMRKGQRGMPYATHRNLEKEEDFMIEEDDRRKVAAGFWAEGEESMGPDEDYYGDDLTSHGHGELKKHRMLREYNRLVAWEMPLLSQLAKPFTPPTPATPFRFRYTSYLNDPHPASNKVVVEFDPTDLQLPPASVSKLIKLAGPRYNPSTSLVKLSCEAFDTQTQNKRFLGQTLKSLIDEAKDMTQSFEDVPFDFRHHRPKKRTEFPREWVLTAERKKYLENKRREGAKLEDQRKNNGDMVDGKMVIETSLPFAQGGGQGEEVPVMAGRTA